MADTYFKNLDPEARKQYVSDVMDRCCKVWGVNEPYEIEDEQGHRGLGHNATTMKMWYTRPSMPWDFILTTAIRKNVSLDYLLLNVNDAKTLDQKQPDEFFDSITKLIADAVFESAEFGIVEHDYVNAIVKKISTNIKNELSLKVYDDAINNKAS